jgi:ubiquinol-cytochrome c reductase cytochrome c1 subunit
MIKKITLSALSALMLTAGAAAANEEVEIEDVAFSFEGPFGKYEPAQLQRGLQVYTEVCSACHGLKYVPLRTLEDLGYNEAQVRTYASQYEIYDPELDDTRPRVPTDHFPESSLPNAPDLSVMAKARAGFKGPYGTGISQLFRGIGGPEHIVAILTSFTGEEKEQAGTTLYENRAFPSGFMAMSPPLAGEDVEFADGSPNDLKHEAEDVAAFLMWTAEPKMMVRKYVGFMAVFFLTVLSVLLYLTNKRLWRPIKHPNES